MKPYYMILDVETNGFLTKTNGASIHSGRVLQIAWALYTAGGRKLNQYNYYINPNNYEVDKTEIHGITEETLIIHGFDFLTVIKKLHHDMKTVKAIVGHHIFFDESVLVNEINIYGITKYLDVFHNVAWVCTQKLAYKLYGKQLQKLEKTYEEIFKKPMENAHNALYDVLGLGEIVTYWLTHKIITKAFQPYPKGGINAYLTQRNKTQTTSIIQ